MNAGPESLEARRAEAERLMALVSERSRELSRLREHAARLRADGGELEAEAGMLLRRILVAADAAGANELRAAVRRELDAIEREI